MENLRWENLGEWLEPPRTDGLPREFRFFKTPEGLENRRVFVVPGRENALLETLEGHHANIPPLTHI